MVVVVVSYWISMWLNYLFTRQTAGHRSRLGIALVSLLALPCIRCPRHLHGLALPLHARRFGDFES